MIHRPHPRSSSPSSSARDAARRVRCVLSSLATVATRLGPRRASRARRLARDSAIGYFRFHTFVPLTVSLRKVRVSTRAAVDGFVPLATIFPHTPTFASRAGTDRARIACANVSSIPSSHRERVRRRVRVGARGIFRKSSSGRRAWALVFVDDRHDRARARREERAREGR